MTPPRLDPPPMPVGDIDDTRPDGFATPEAIRAWFRAKYGVELATVRPARPPTEPNAKGLKYSDDQPRDDAGRWTDTGGGGGGEAIEAGATITADAPAAPARFTYREQRSFGAIANDPEAGADGRAQRAEERRAGTAPHFPSLADDPNGDAAYEADPFERLLGHNAATERSHEYIGAAPPLEEFEAQVCDNPYETMAAYDEVDGRLVPNAAITQHDANSTNPQAIADQVVGAAVLSHNHPYPTAPSPGDVGATISLDIGRVRACGRLPDGDRYVDELRIGDWHEVGRRLTEKAGPYDARYRLDGDSSRADTGTAVRQFHEECWEAHQSQWLRANDFREFDQPEPHTPQYTAMVMYVSEHAIKDVAETTGMQYTRTLIPAGPARSGAGRTPGSRRAPRPR